MSIKAEKAQRKQPWKKKTKNLLC